MLLSCSEGLGRRAAAPAASYDHSAQASIPGRVVLTCLCPQVTAPPSGWTVTSAPASLVRPSAPEENASALGARSRSVPQVRLTDKQAEKVHLQLTLKLVHVLKWTLEVM